MIIGINPYMVSFFSTTYEKGDRMFYELGYKKDMNLKNGPNNWIRTGQFKEIENSEEYIKLDSERLKIKEFIIHHNFMFIKEKDLEKVGITQNDKEKIDFSKI